MRSILVCCLAALLLLPAAASASRKATKSERSALGAAANRSPQTEYADCVKVRNAKI